ncbi:MAG: hypothetical protein IJQ28_08505, partial [Clostridia bacterium]|nr:hypothetical protein [Clostridia bacterium]
LGMCVTVSAKMGENGSLIRNIVLFAVLIYELFGPVMTKNALMASGDITPKSEEVLNRRKARLEEGNLRKPSKKA